MNKTEQFEVIFHSSGSTLQKLFSRGPQRSPRKNDRGERTVSSRIKTQLWSPEICWLASPCHLDKKRLKIQQNLTEALITQLETKNGFYAPVKSSRLDITQWIDWVLQTGLYSFKINECHRMDVKLAWRTLKLLLKLLYEKGQLNRRFDLSNT